MSAVYLVRGVNSSWSFDRECIEAPRTFVITLVA